MLGLAAAVSGPGSTTANASGGGMLGGRGTAASDGRMERRSGWGISPSSWRTASTNSAGKRGGFSDGDSRLLDAR
jgi:hypothetical protein